MNRKSQNKTALTTTAESLERAIHLIRGQRVMLDADLAALYGVSTKRLNQSVKRNASRFPEDFAFQLTESETVHLLKQIAKSRSGGPRYRPWVFTEHGVAMLSSVLRSETAAKVNIEIMRAFVRLRRLMATPGELAQQLAKLAETISLHDEQIQAIIQVLRQLTASPEPVKEMGFHTIHRPR